MEALIHNDSTAITFILINTTNKNIIAAKIQIQVSRLIDNQNIVSNESVVEVDKLLL